jgi:hypothetical protein
MYHELRQRLESVRNVLSEDFDPDDMFALYLEVIEGYNKNNNVEVSNEAMQIIRGCAEIQCGEIMLSTGDTYCKDDTCCVCSANRFLKTNEI